MKKLLFLVLTVLILSCSSDDNNSVICGQSSIAGTWDSDLQIEGVSVLSLAFNSDGTGTYTLDEDEEFSIDFIWESTDSAITTSVPLGDDITIEWWVADYEFFGCDQLRLQIVWSDDTIGDIDLILDRR
jgi:hypothetical protein